MTSNPWSRSARVMVLAPRSCPSSPGLATTIRYGRSTNIRPYATGHRFHQPGPWPAARPSVPARPSFPARHHRYRVAVAVRSRPLPPGTIATGSTSEAPGGGRQNGGGPSAEVARTPITRRASVGADPAVGSRSSPCSASSPGASRRSSPASERSRPTTSLRPRLELGFGQRSGQQRGRRRSAAVRRTVDDHGRTFTRAGPRRRRSRQRVASLLRLPAGTARLPGRSGGRHRDLRRLRR